MSKKHFIEMADAIIDNNSRAIGPNADRTLFTADQIETLADFCASQNPAFMRDRWLSYIAGECGKNGGAVKAKRAA